MNWAWANSLDHFWRSPSFPMWLTLAAAGFFAIIVLITLLRAEKSVANGALTIITLLAIGVAVAANIRGFGPAGRGMSADPPSSAPLTVALPALSCIDDLAGEAVLIACEKNLFGSPDSAAAALSYAASMITRLRSSGDVAAANANMTPELQALRRAIERDRYGLMAYVLQAREHCAPSDCAVFRSLTDRHQIAANMDERVYEATVARNAPSWNAPPPAAVPVAALPLMPPPGKPTNAEFPTAASTPPISIMNPEPGTAPPAPARPPATTTAPRPPAVPPATAVVAAKKKPPAHSAPAAPVQLAPAAPAPAGAPAAAND